MDQNVHVGERSVESPSRRRFDQSCDDLRWTPDKQRCGNRVNRCQRPNWAVIVVDGRVFGMMFQDAVGFQVAMNDDMEVALLLGFVDVLRWGDREQPHRSAQHAREKRRNVHDRHRAFTD